MARSLCVTSIVTALTWLAEGHFLECFATIYVFSRDYCKKRECESYVMKLCHEANVVKPSCVNDVA